MNLETLETKEPLVKEFFTWLFDDTRIIDKDITLESEIDLALVPYYKDAHIYYPKQIANLLSTTAMKRLARISQLDLVIDEFPNAYHNRLEHSKGVYYRKLEEMLHNFQKPSWKKDIENTNMKLYLLAELIKMLGHDIGHFPLSHAFEQAIYSCHGPHEIWGKRIMLEDSEIQSILISISPDLPNALKDLYKKPILNFQEHDESNYDVDRFDYLYRDNLYAGTPIFIPYSHYESISISIDDSGLPKKSSDGSLLTSDSSNFTVDVYDYEALREIEHFLEIRENSYKRIYFSPKAHVRENSINTLFKAFLESSSQSGKDLRKFVNILTSCDINDIDLSSFLEWDDIKFYSEILDIAENHEDHNIRQLATMTFPNMNAFLTMLHYQLNLNNKKQEYSEQDKKFLKKIKSLIIGQTSLSQSLKSPSFAKDNTLIYPQSEALPDSYNRYVNDGLILSSKVKIKAYNPKEPIYIRGANGKIYDLSHHPDRKCDWDSRISYIHNVYAYIPFLKLHGISNEEIEEMRNFCNSTPSPIDSKPRCCSIYMKPSKVSKYIVENDFLDL